MADISAPHLSSDGTRPGVPRSPAFLAGGGELGSLMRAKDWSQTPLGPPETWPQSLKTAVRIMFTSRQPIWVGWGPELIYLYNDPYKAIVGGKHPEALGRPTQVVWREIRDVIGPMLSTAMAGDEGTYVESQLLIMERHGYREETYYTFSYSPIPNDDGSPGGIICANTDDTRRVIGERQLALLREISARTINARTWQEAAAGAQSALATNSRDVPFALLFLSRPEVPGLTLAGLSGIERTHPAAGAAGAGIWPLEEAIAAREIIELDDIPQRLTVPLPSGAWSEAPTRVALVPLVGAGETGRSGVLVVGLSPFRLLDENYRNFLGLIGNQIASSIASADAYEEERRRAQALAELDRAKTEFFSNVSHEFRTPLTLMLGPVEDMLEKSYTELTPATKNQLEIVHRNSLRLLRLVNTMLDFSRIEAGRVEASFSPVDLAAVTAELASVFRAAIERAGLRFIVDCPPLREPAYVDRDMWEKIVLNLLSNAFKFTLAGEIELKLSAEAGQAVLTVRDTGVGIPASDVERVFERFHRVKDSRGRTHEGTGIGLALVQELVRMHGGTIRAESVLNEGSRFILTLPLGREHLDAARIRTLPERLVENHRAAAFAQEAMRWIPGVVPSPDQAWARVGQAALPPGGGTSNEAAAGRPRVVWADDNADMRDYVQRLLAERFAVTAVSDGEAALEAIRANPPDIVLSDVMMPKLDGFGLLRALRADAALSNIPIILLSARAGEEARVEGVEAGADDYLIKPFSARELLARVEAHVKMARYRREADAALRESEARFRAIVEYSPLGVYVVDADFRLRHVNPTARPVFGEIPGLIGRDFAEVLRVLWPENFADELVRIFRHTMETGESYSNPERVEQRVDRDAVEVYQWRVDRIPMLDGRYGVVCYFRDISAEVRARRLVSESEERYRSLVSVITDVPWTADESGAFVVQQPAWEAYTGQRWEQHRGHGWTEAIHPDDRARLLAEWQVKRSGSGRHVTRGRLWNAARQEWRHFEVQATPLLEADGRVREWVGAVTDTEARMRAEEQLKSARDHALAANRAKDEFLATLSHELRTPLNPVLLASSEAARDPALPDAVRADFRMIADNVALQARLIDDLLDLSRITRGKLTLELTPLNIHEVMRDAAKTIAEDVAAKNIALSFELQATEPVAQVDPVRLRQVFWNVLKNAVKFTPAGGRVVVSSNNLPDANEFEIGVRDTGIGMGADELTRIFQPFVQGRHVSDEEGHSYGGLGLGLAISRMLVESHGGSIAAASPGVDQGSTITVRLPRVQATATSRNSANGFGHPLRSTATADQSGRRILFVEDHAPTRATLTTLLRRRGYSVVTAGTVAEAVEAAGKGEFDVLISDLGLPDGDGCMVIGELRRRKPDLPGVVISGYGMDTDLDRTRNAGFREHLTKPVSFDSLERALGRLFDTLPTAK